MNAHALISAVAPLMAQACTTQAIEAAFDSACKRVAGEYYASSYQAMFSEVADALRSKCSAWAMDESNVSTVRQEVAVAHTRMHLFCGRGDKIVYRCIARREGVELVAEMEKKQMFDESSIGGGGYSKVD